MPVDDKQLRAALHSRFQSLVGSPKGDEVAYHLADLHHGLTHAARTIERIADLGEARGEDRLRTLLAELGGELFEHIDPHVRSVRPALEELIADLFERADSRGEL